MVGEATTQASRPGAAGKGLTPGCGVRGGVQGRRGEGGAVSLPKRSRESNERKVIVHWGSPVASRRRWHHEVLALTVGELDMPRWSKVFKAEEAGVGHTQEPGSPFAWLKAGLYKRAGWGLKLSLGWDTLCWDGEQRASGDPHCPCVPWGCRCREWAVLVWKERKKAEDRVIPLEDSCSRVVRICMTTCF